MPTRTGHRIRERRLDLGLKQADLARQVGISGSYLNLIEHNRRGIGGKLLNDIARVLAVEPVDLAEGAAAALVDAVSAAALAGDLPDSALGRRDQLIGRFPDWARLIARQADQIAALEDRIEGLSDRLAHDPALGDMLHEVLSSVTSIRSTSSILAQTPDIDAQWQRRFHANLFEDSSRLADTSQGLVSYFDALAQEDRQARDPLDSVLRAAVTPGRFADAIEAGQGDAALAALDGAVDMSFAQPLIERLIQDAQLLPAPQLNALRVESGWQVEAMACSLADLPLAILLRRLALTPQDGGVPLGLVEVDGAGALTLRRPIEGFALPRFGAACPLWPLFDAGGGGVVGQRVEVDMPPGDRFTVYTAQEVASAGGFGAPTVLRRVMLIERSGAPDTDPARPVGTACRICPRTDCAARREPSLVANTTPAGFDSA